MLAETNNGTTVLAALVGIAGTIGAGLLRSWHSKRRDLRRDAISDQRARVGLESIYTEGIQKLLDRYEDDLEAIRKDLESVRKEAELLRSENSTLRREISTLRLQQGELRSTMSTVLALLQKLESQINAGEKDLALETIQALKRHPVVAAASDDPPPQPPPGGPVA